MEPQSQLRIFGEVVLAAFLGGLVGFEREYAGKPAGLRTHMLVSASAAFLVALGNYIVYTFEFPSYVSSDPVRIIHAIIVGISFLGAGTILRRQGENQVEGLTTSASILAAAAVGIGTAIGLLYLAIGVTAVILFVNWVMSPVEVWLERRASEAD